MSDSILSKIFSAIVAIVVIVIAALSAIWLIRYLNSSDGKESSISTSIANQTADLFSSSKKNKTEENPKRQSLTSNSSNPTGNSSSFPTASGSAPDNTSDKPTVDADSHAPYNVDDSDKTEPERPTLAQQAEIERKNALVPPISQPTWDKPYFGDKHDPNDVELFTPVTRNSYV